MESNGNSKSGLLTAGGVLSIIGGVSQIVSVPAYFLVYRYATEVFFLPFLPDGLRAELLWWFPRWNISARVSVGVCVGVLGILAVAGGISAIRRKKFGLSLAGAICALASGFLGILAVIFVSLGKREFGAERKENGI